VYVMVDQPLVHGDAQAGRTGMGRHADAGTATTRPTPGAPRAGPSGDQAAGQTARGLAKATLLSLVLRVAGVGIGIVTTALLARHLEPAGYGMLSLALTLGAATVQIADLGVASATSTLIAQQRHDAGRILGTGVALRTLFALVASVGLIATALAGAFGSSSGVVAVIALATPLSATAVLTAGSTARFRPETAAILTVAQGAAWLAVVFLVVRSGGSVPTLAWCFVGISVLQTGLSVSMNRKIIPIARPSMADARRILSLSWPLAVSSLAVTAYYRLDSVILLKAKGAAELGYYSAAYKLLDVAQLAPGVIGASLFPLAAGSIAMSRSARQVILSLAGRSAAMIGVGSAVMFIVLATPLISFLYGNEFAPAANPLRLLAVAFIGVTFGWVGTIINTAYGQVRPIMMLTVPVAAVSLLAQVWACTRWGATGAAAVTAGTELVVGGGTCLLAARAMSARLPLRELAICAATGGAIVLGGALVHLQPILEAFLAAVVFAVVVLATRILTTADIRRVLSKKVL
jgi:O-antigen/teichoic acid export membrane protein